MAKRFGSKHKIVNDLYDNAGVLSTVVSRFIFEEKRYYTVVFMQDGEQRMSVVEAD